MKGEINPSGIDWIGDIPAEWDVKKLRYATALRSESGYFSAGDIYIGLENIESSTGKYIRTETEYSNGLYDIVRKGDVLFGKLRPYLEKVYISAIDGFCTGEFLNFKKFEGNKRYLYYFLLSHSFIETVNASTYGAKMPRAEWDFIKNLRIPIPPLAEQQAIAAFLDAQCGRIDGIITEMERQTEVLKQYKTSLITETVTKGLDKSAPMKNSGMDWIGDIPAHWEVKKIKYVFQIICGSTPDSNNIDFWDGDIPWITPADMNDFGTIYKGERNITKRGYNSCGTLLLPEGSIVISTRAPIGKINIASSKLCTNQGCKSLVNPNVNTKYFYYHLNAGQDDLIRRGHGTTFIELSAFELGDVFIAFPPPAEQKSIAAFLDAQCGRIDSIIAEKRQSIETMRAYKKSLIYEYVTGKKRVSDK